tara:strand:- start:958 stop:1146 length:189 start_codon:yes stop_codon:yes gene_type:complete
MQKLALFKLIDDNLVFCGYFDTQEQITEYLAEIKKLVDEKVQHQLTGEYLALPSIMYKLERK